MLLGVARHVADPGFPREDIIGASEWLDANVSNDEELLVSSDEMAYLARFHWPQRRLTVDPPPGVVVSDDKADAVVNQLPSVGTQRVIYIFGRAWLSDPIGALQRTLRERYRSAEKQHGVAFASSVWNDPAPRLNPVLLPARMPTWRRRRTR